MEVTDLYDKLVELSWLNEDTAKGDSGIFANEVTEIYSKCLHSTKIGEKVVFCYAFRQSVALPLSYIPLARKGGT